MHPVSAIMLNQSGRRIAGGLAVVAGILWLSFYNWLYEVMLRSIPYGRAVGIGIAAILFGAYYLLTGGGEDRPAGG